MVEKKRVKCLYRVSTKKQVENDDIPMQRQYCRDFAAQHPDWEIIDEVYEKAFPATRFMQKTGTN